MSSMFSNFITTSLGKFVRLQIRDCEGGILCLKREGGYSASKRRGDTLPQNIEIVIARNSGHNSDLILSLLGFKCTCFEIKSRDMNEKGKDFIFITDHI